MTTEYSAAAGFILRSFAISFLKVSATALLHFLPFDLATNSVISLSTGSPPSSS